MKKALIIVIGLIVAFIAVGFVLPSDFKVERSIVIDAPAEEIYPRIVDLRRWQDWGVWFKRDPQMEVSFSGPDRAIGMKSEWKSETEGNGEMQIIALEHNQRVSYSLYFPDFEMGSTGEFVLQAQNDNTLVTWTDEGDVGNNPLNRYFALMMDSMIGPDFEAGLDNLKMLTENGS